MLEVCEFTFAKNTMSMSNKPEIGAISNISGSNVFWAKNRYKFHIQIFFLSLEIGAGPRLIKLPHSFGANEISYSSSFNSFLEIFFFQ